MDNNNQILLNNLIKSLFFPLSPPPSLVNSLLKYTLKVNQSFDPSILESILSKKSPTALSLFKKLKLNPLNLKLVYAFLCMEENTKKLPCIKFYALGIKANTKGTSTYDSTFLYSQGLIYRQLKIEKENPNSLIYKGFLEEVSSEIREYEESILKAPVDFLGFYSETFEKTRKIRKIAEIGEFIKNRRYLTESKEIFDKIIDITHSLNPLPQCFNSPQNSNQQLSDSNTTQCSNTTQNSYQPLSDSNQPQNYNQQNSNQSLYNIVYCKFRNTLFNFYNSMTHSYLSTGHVDDPFNEFFIKNHILDYGLIPSFISIKTAETICYIGKYNSFLKSINKKQYLLFKKIDLSKNSCSTILKNLLKTLNKEIYNDFFLKFKIFDLLSFVNSTFLFGRIDFIEFLFNTMKESKKTGRRNISSILETALSKIFPNSPFNDLMDIYIVDSEMSSSFSLFIKLEYPHTLLIEEDFVIKLVYIFKFLWKIKRLEYLTRKTDLSYSKVIDNYRVGENKQTNKCRVGESEQANQLTGENKQANQLIDENNTMVRENKVLPCKKVNLVIMKYRLLIQKLEFYIFNEVIGDSLFKNEFKWDGFAFDEFKKDLNGRLDGMIARLHINTKERKIEHFMYKLEKFLIGVFKNEDFDEKEVDKSFSELYSECNFIKKLTFY